MTFAIIREIGGIIKGGVEHGFSCGVFVVTMEKAREADRTLWLPTFQS